MSEDNPSTDERVDLLTLQVRELLGVPEEWHWFEWECLPENGPTQVMRVKGAVAPVYEIGKRKGQRNWRGRDKQTEREAYITPDQRTAWLAKWEAETGKCHVCQGTCQETSGWDHIKGTTYRPCTRCKATGKPS